LTIWGAYVVRDREKVGNPWFSWSWFSCLSRLQIIL